jgi:hypothetical protein
LLPLFALCSSISVASTTFVMSMNAESSAFKDELDRLKSKYRKEALRAVAAASADAYEKGKMEAREQFERDVGRWKAVAEAVQSNDLGHSKPTLLVQHVVEQVYRDMKQDFSDTKELSMAKIKVREAESHSDGRHLRILPT